ncbi:FtsX-like permease family protein [Rugosimonospora africana]|uniref:ABC3 transporter permease C-terminal domain-containing protein n=1 Tax=Rugosimonospora africana TaxID=556532 RepID=A0A8J3QNR4_9ACTN|nr:FtsX-like permease family protein [Rugosimonospora africana]GIH13504.1 hypothetical protein Raf01_16760 [Rugosimonospora africana]
MIGLILAMLRARLGRALTALLLAVVAVAAAVAGPAFMAAADRSVIADELSRATPLEMMVEASGTVDLSQVRDRTFETGAVGLLTGPGLTPIFAAEFDAFFTGPADGGAARLVFRQGLCAHLRMVRGRCPIGTNEVVLGRATADRLGLASGQVVAERESVQTQDGPTATGPTADLTVVGVYEVPDRTDRYWADQHYFDVSPGSDGQAATGEPVFTSRGTLEVLRHTKETQTVDSLLDPAALTPANLATVRASAEGAQHRAAASAISAGTQIPALLKRIDTDRSTLREVVPLASVPLVILAWLVMLLAAGYATEARRAEVGLFKLRGTSLIARWWLVLGESVVAILIGGALGYLVGYAVVAVAAHLLLPGAGAVTPSWAALRWAGAAVLGTLVATVLAQRRPFAAPVAELLRQVPPRGAGWRGLALEAMLYPLTVAAVVELHADHDKLTGIMLLAPGLVVLAVALLAARVVGPLAGWIGRRALRSGRLGLGLGALRLARRPGAARLLALLVVAVAQLGFAFTAAGVASRAGAERVTVEQGAPQVLDVLPVNRGALLDAVRAADPTGRYAMAVATVPSIVSTDAPTLAVDSTRLAAVANWRAEGGLSAARAAAALRPAEPDPVTFHNETMRMDLSVGALQPAQILDLVVHLAPVNGDPAQVVNVGQLRSGRHTYTATLPGCAHGCRLIGFEVSQPTGAGFNLNAVVHGLYQGDPATPMNVGLTEKGRWRAPGHVGPATVPTVTPGPDGLSVNLTDSGVGVDAWILPVDAPYPLPVVLTGRLGRDTVGGLDDIPQPVVAAGTVPVLPRLGDHGTMVDFEYAERDARDTGVAVNPQVWLAADAPASILDRLRGNGLTVVETESDEARLRYLDRQGPAAGMRFHLLAGVLAVLLAVGGLVLIATVDRRAAGQLRALRVQGVPRAVVASANRYGYAGLVLAALVLGPIAAGAAWALTGRSIPLFADGVALLPPPLVPHWPPLVIALAIAGLLLMGIALVSSRLLSAGLEGRRGEHG